MKKLGPAHLAVSCFDGPNITWFLLSYSPSSPRGGREGAFSISHSLIFSFLISTRLLRRSLIFSFFVVLISNLINCDYILFVICFLLLCVLFRSSPKDCDLLPSYSHAYTCEHYYLYIVDLLY